MELFIKSLEKLTKKIQEDSNLGAFSFDLVDLLNATQQEVVQIHKEVKGIEIIAVDEFWDLTEEIYKRLMLKTIEKGVTNFFIKVHESNFSNSIVISYKFTLWDKFTLAVENTGLSDELLIDFEYGENQIEKLLDHLQVNDPRWYQGLYDFDYSFNFESTVESLFRELAFNCWQKIKPEYNRHTRTFIREYNGGSHTYDLDTGNIKK